VKTELGPDATSLGWSFSTPRDRSGKHASDELRSYQDWFMRYAVQSVPGVAEVATVGGQVRQYQVTVRPDALAAYKLPLNTVVEAVRRATTTWAPFGRAVRARIHGARSRVREVDRRYREAGLKTENGTPITVKDVATVALGPEMRRGIADYNGTGTSWAASW